tara:strand:- start:253 stop:1158 length:906 start_codon:yes stop_codon:yes gene_type:complete
MNSLNLKHSIIFFNLSILMSPIYQKTSYALVITCLLLILIIGISHGALDNVKGEKLFKLLGYNSKYLFYLSYIIISLLIIFLWLILPNLILLIFLIVASYHFGKEDTVFKVKKRVLSNEILFFLKGSSIIISPLLFQRDSTNEIFATLNFYVFESPFFNDFTLIIFLVLGFFSNIYLTIDKSINFKNIMILDYFSIIILNIFLTPILAFTLYFCFLHSVRHSFSLINEIDRSFKIGLKKFIMKAIPLTLITSLIFLSSIYFLNNLYEIDEAIYKVIFIGLASLTFPHILLEYLLEKNEKRN